MLHHKEVEQLCRTRSQAVPGEAAYLKSYQNALKTYAESLPEDQQAQYQEMAINWTNQSPPQDVQQRSLFINGHTYVPIDHFCTEWPNCMGLNISNNLPVSCGNNAV